MTNLTEKIESLDNWVTAFVFVITLLMLITILGQVASDRDINNLKQRIEQLEKAQSK